MDVKEQQKAVKTEVGLTEMGLFSLSLGKAQGAPCQYI